jgi:hypothetical protein
MVLVGLVFVDADDERKQAKWVGSGNYTSDE